MQINLGRVPRDISLNCAFTLPKSRGVIKMSQIHYGRDYCLKD